MRHSLLTNTELLGLDRDQLLRRLAGGDAPDGALASALDRALESVDAAGLEAHALDVAEILRHLNVDRQTLIATLLVPVFLAGHADAKALRRDYGERVAQLTENVSALVRRRFETPAGRPEQAERLRRMLMAMVDDVRAVLIKLAFRVQHLRLVVKEPDASARALAQETLDVIAPLANRLGVGQLKWEMEDLSLRILEPETYRDIARGLEENRTEREEYVARFTRMLEKHLADAGIEARVFGRPKHIYSIWKKMQRKNTSLSELYDLRATRVIVDRLATCYTVLGVVHNHWRHLPGEFDDYIANPKDNGYQSLHTAVVGPEGKVVEVQIRTREMDEFAELGVAAHWRYKEGGREDRALNQAITSLRQLLENDGSDQNLLDEIQSEPLHQRVFVLTPQGDVLDLAQGATPLDFAYAVHTEVGHRCRGAKVDGRIVPLTYRLRSGERVEVLTAREGGPSRDWLNPNLGYLNTSRARAKVRTWFRQQHQDEHLATGKQLFDRECQRLGLHERIPDLDRDELARQMKYPGFDELMIALGAGDITTGQIAGRLAQMIRERRERDKTREEAPAAPSPRRREGRRDGDAADHNAEDIRIRGVGGLLTTRAQCCDPQPGDPIIGFITRGAGVSVHRDDCPNILHLPEDKRARLIPVSWGDEPETEIVSLELEAQDRAGLFAEVGGVFSQSGINLLRVNTQTDPADRSVRMELEAEVTDLGELSGLFDRLHSLDNVYEVRRVSPGGCSDTPPPPAGPDAGP
ncbi:MULTISPECIES: bifunctional (p)ppGpp synthetase/guanosine-3',5'-bis(diphosphate) 3'-pyrophosphohydrolase [unclassified Thioalkalivibrio]|uniref:RelA/SpoT family protein n=1 Tax=unclassified Thioalkalivibrio TaxID=2621013 RepID=UPI000371D7BF|nr:MULTISPECIES: bifunctional (p)ppGpp synthetase/guanosine-3',5'-bis(diphosphate) 3'-pyrophosphohydrolase [unclassified Thioalkalivibrio]